MRVVFVVLALAGAARTRRPRSRAIEVLSREPMAGQAVGAAGPYEIVRGRVHGEVDAADRRNAIIQDLPLAPRNARGRAEYVATFALAKPVDLAKASGVLIYSVVNRGNGSPQASADGHVWLVSGWQGDLQPAADKQTIVVPVARNADGTPITGRMIARFVNAAPGTTTLPIRHATIGNPPPAYPPAGLEQRDARLISVGSETARRRPTRRPRGAARRLGVRRLPHRAVSRDARRDAAVREGRLRSEAALPAGLHRPGSAGARHRPGGDARHHGVLPRRRRGRAGHAESGRRRHPPRGRDRRLAVGELHPDLHPSRLQRRRRRARDLGRRVPADRGAADADQRALRRAGRRRRAVRGGQRAGDLVGRLRGSDPPAPPRQPARSLHRLAHLSEDRRGVRIGGVLGTPHVAGSGRHRRPDGHPAAGQRPPLLLSRHDARRRTRRLRGRRRPGAARLHAARPTRTRRPTRRGR